MRNLPAYCLLLCATAIACNPKDPEDTATTTVSTSGASTGTGDATSAPTTGTPTTGASAETSGSDSATGSTGNTGSTGPESSSTTGAPTTGGSTDFTTDFTTGFTTGDSGETDTGVMVACDGSGTSTLDGVCIVFPPQQDQFSLAQVAAGVMFDYVVIVTADVPGVTAEAQKTCDEPKSSGLYIGESVEGDGQNYCICDNGLCPPPMDPPATLKAGEYPASIEWDGKNWNGPSDTNNPKGKPFPPGDYTVKVRTSGQHQGKPFEVTAELPITLTP